MFQRMLAFMQTGQKRGKCSYKFVRQFSCDKRVESIECKVVY